MIYCNRLKNNDEFVISISLPSFILYNIDQSIFENGGIFLALPRLGRYTGLQRPSPLSRRQLIGTVSKSYQNIAEAIVKLSCPLHSLIILISLQHFSNNFVFGKLWRSYASLSTCFSNNNSSRNQIFRI